MKAVNWFREFGPAVLAAKAERKPILVDFYSETCLGCRQMDAVTYSRSEVQVLEREFTAVKQRRSP
jgi:thiol:disulfide interchange protein